MHKNRLKYRLKYRLKVDKNRLNNFMERIGRTLAGLALLSAIAGCAPIRVVGPNYTSPPSGMAAAWQTTQPHNGSKASLAQWWQQFDDPVLVQLIEQAQTENSSVAQAQSRIVQARGQVIAASAASQPNLDVGTNFNRAAVSFGGPVIVRSLTQVQAQSAWEIDLFGANRREREAVAARLDARQADWHEARVAVATEVANLYLQLRFCELQVMVLEEDLKSRRETARLTELSAKAGFQAPANAALIKASASDAAARLIAQQADCDLSVKALVALSGSEENAMRNELAKGKARQPQVAEFSIAQVPAELLTQRPDLTSAERELAAASADIGIAEAARYPRLSLSGSIAPVLLASAGQTVRALTWSVGPAITLPVFDGGRRLANVETAKANYQSAEAHYRQKVRQAVREVEEALIRLASANNRKADVNAAADGYRANLAAAQSRFGAGVGSVLELEESRRLSLVAEANVIAIQRDRVTAWVSLYRAMGGGWTSQTPSKP